MRRVEKASARAEPSSAGSRPRRPSPARGRRWPTPVVWPTTPPQAAKEAAEEARQRAERLAEDANARAEEAEQRVADAERRSEAVAEGRAAPWRANGVNGTAELDELTKAELLELADGMGLEVNSHQLQEGAGQRHQALARK